VCVCVCVCVCNIIISLHLCDRPALLFTGQNLSGIMYVCENAETLHIVANCCCLQ